MANKPVEEFPSFLEECRRAVGEQVAGRTEAFHALWSQADDVVLLGAAGSYNVGWTDVSSRLAWTSSHLSFTNFEARNLVTVVDEVVGFTLDLEHMTRAVEGEQQERTLRVSQGYRYEKGRWRIVFRHGDPMIDDILPRPA
jgi:hypothetical protein